MQFANLCVKQVSYLSMDCGRGLFEARRNGERAALASAPIRKAALRAERDRKIDLAAAPAADAISCNYRK